MTYAIRNQKRVAVASIRGYRYQLLHTIRAWLRIDDDRVIVAEGNEDLDHIFQQGGITVAIEEQVKYRSASITQGDEAVSETILALRACWWTLGATAGALGARETRGGVSEST